MTDPNVQPQVQLREVLPGDLPILFAHQCDSTAIQMAAFTSVDPGDLAAFEARWARFLANPDIIPRTILAGGEVAGSIATYLQEGERELTYWIGSAYWGRGIATAAARLMLEIDTTRPLFSRAAKDNIGSLRVLEKCGFQIIGEGSDFAEARGAITEEVILCLDGASASIESAVADKEEAIVAQDGRLELSESDFGRFLTAIANPPAPTAELRAAAEAYKKLSESDPNW